MSEWVEQDHHPFEDETTHGKVVWNRQYFHYHCTTGCKKFNGTMTGEVSLLNSIYL